MNSLIPALLSGLNLAKHIKKSMNEESVRGGGPKKNFATSSNYKEGKALALNKVLIEANEMKDRVILELRSELIKKSEKIG